MKTDYRDIVKQPLTRQPFTIQKGLAMANKTSQTARISTKATNAKSMSVKRKAGK